MAGKRRSMIGTTTDNETARERTHLERRRLRETRLIEDLFRSDPRFPAQMNFSVFKAKLGRIYRSDGSRSCVKDWKGASHWFPAGEERRALEYAVRLLANKPGRRTGKPEPMGDDKSAPKTIVTKDGARVRVWRT